MDNKTEVDESLKQRGMTVKGLGILVLLVGAASIISIFFQTNGILHSITEEHIIMGFFKLLLLGLTAILNIFIALFGLWITFDASKK